MKRTSTNLFKLKQFVSYNCIIPQLLSTRNYSNDGDKKYFLPWYSLSFTFSYGFQFHICYGPLKENVTM